MSITIARIIHSCLEICMLILDCLLILISKRIHKKNSQKEYGLDS